MEPATLSAFENELVKIAESEKDAGVRDSLRAGANALKSAKSKADTALLKGYVRLATRSTKPGASVLDRGIQYVTDPMNVADLAGSVNAINRFT